MRINKFVAQATGISRRTADKAIEEGRVTINGQPAEPGDAVDGSQFVRLDDELIILDQQTVTIMLNKPVGYVCSRNGQGNPTIYELLPAEFHRLKPVGRLDKDSSGLILLTNDGNLANQLTHPRYAKTKVYEVSLDKPLQPLHQQMISNHGINLEDGLSKFTVIPTEVEGTRSSSAKADGISRQARDDNSYQVTMQQGRNRQIRRTFASLGYEVTRLHRTQFGSYQLGALANAKSAVVS